MESTADDRSGATGDRLAGALSELSRAEVVAFGGVGFAGQLLPVTAAFQEVRAAGAGARPEVEALLDQATPEGKVYAATLLAELDPAAGESAWRRLAGEPAEVNTFTGCLRATTPLAEYARARLAG